MPKQSREPMLRRGEALLAEWRIPDGDVPALCNALGRDPSADLAVAARLGDIAGDESATALQELERRARDKHVRKEAKRSLYRLAQRGVAIPAAESAPRPALDLGPTLEGALSSVDGNGDQVVWITRSGDGAVLNLFAVVNDPGGLTDVELVETSRKGLRLLRSDMEERHGLRLVEADWRYCDSVIDRAFRWSRERGAKVGDYPGMRARLTREPVAAPIAPIRALLDAAEVEQDPQLLERSRDLMREPELHVWIFRPDSLQQFIDASLEILASPLVLSEEQKQERLSDVAASAVAEQFGGAMQASWVRRIETLAYVLHRSGRVESARSAFAVALALEKSTDAGRGIPLLELLVRTCLSAYVEVAQTRLAKEREESLVVTPQEADERRRD